jgi:hypothetical protein
MITREFWCFVLVGFFSISVQGCSDGAVTGDDNGPVAKPDSYSTDQDSVLEVGDAAGVLANDSGDQGLGLYADLVNSPTHGTLSLRPEGGFTYTPDPAFNGMALRLQIQAHSTCKSWRLHPLASIPSFLLLARRAVP